MRNEKWGGGVFCVQGWVFGAHHAAEKIKGDNFNTHSVLKSSQESQACCQNREKNGGKRESPLQVRPCPPSMFHSYSRMEPAHSKERILCKFVPVRLPYSIVCATWKQHIAKRESFASSSCPPSQFHSYSMEATHSKQRLTPFPIPFLQQHGIST